MPALPEDQRSTVRLLGAVAVLFFSLTANAVAKDADVAAPGAPAAGVTAPTAPAAPGNYAPYTHQPTTRPKAARASTPPGHWEVYASPTTKTLYAVSFSDENNGWAVGSGVIIRYQNGSWSTYLDNNNYLFDDVDMVNANDGWLVAFNGNDSRGELWHWNGSSWTLAQTYPGYLYCVDMIDATHGWAGDNPTLLRYNGSSWEETGSGPNEIDDIFMVNDSNGRATSFHAVVKWDGNNWTVEASDPNWNFGHVYLLDGQTGWATGQYLTTTKGMLLRYNGSWSLYAIYGDSRFLVGIDFLSNGTGWCVGRKNPNPPYGAYMLYHDGTDWQSITAPSDRGLMDVKLLTTTSGWAVGEAGTILKYVPNVAITPTSMGRVKALFH